ncbi:MAG: peptide MFS transporter [Candidatus Latescibacteria bacterium]|nr:peptide MFS transporter [Candidatus Latescibacterota bacterium]
MPGETGTVAPKHTIWGHPIGLSTLFFTELWERFSYYGMRAILILFLTDTEHGGFAMSSETAGVIYGLYTASVYLVALPGGWIADRLIGQRSAIFVGGLIIAAGHFSLAISGTTPFYLGLILIVIGTGLLKPNVSAIVGGLYPEGGARRDAGFSIFYMGINLGAFIGPLVCGYLGQEVNWHLGFGAAGVGMLLGLVAYGYGQRYLGELGKAPQDDADIVAGNWKYLLSGLAILIVLAVSLAGLRGIYPFTLEDFGIGLGYSVIAISILYFAYVLLLGGLDTGEQKRVLVIFFLFIGAALFWSGFEQAGSALNLFAERLTNTTILSYEVPASWLQSVNPLFIIIFAPLFSWLWVALMHREPSIPVKFAYGLILLGVGFLVIAWGATHVSDGGPGVSPAWLIVTYFFHTVGELCLSPVGLSSITKLAPGKYVGQMMGIWFMGAALGNLFAGLIGGKFETLPLPDLFLSVATVVIISGVLFAIFSKPIKKLIGGRV